MSEQLAFDWDASAVPAPAPVPARLDLSAHLTALTRIFVTDGPSAEALQRLGWTEICTITPTEVHATGPSGVRTAFVRGHDPIAVATCPPHDTACPSRRIFEAGPWNCGGEGRR